MLNQPMSNLQISGGQHRVPPPTAPGMHGVRAGQPTMPPPQVPMPASFRSDQQSPLRQFTPRMATGITPPRTGAPSQPQYPGDQQSPLRQFAPRMATGIAPPSTGAPNQPQYPGPGPIQSQGLPNGKVRAHSQGRTVPGGRGVNR